MRRFCWKREAIEKRSTWSKTEESSAASVQIAASKTQGYAVMSDMRLHKRHFPMATVESFTVPMIAPTSRRRDALPRSIASRPGADCWKFASAQDLTPERFLHDAVFYPCVGDPLPLVKTPPSASETVEKNASHCRIVKARKKDTSTAVSTKTQTCTTNKTTNIRWGNFAPAQAECEPSGRWTRKARRGAGP